MEKMLNYREIAEKLGLTSPWLLLDMLRRDDDAHFVGFKNFTVNETFFVGHFPIHPIVPGVLHVESMRQLCCCCLPGDPKKKRIVRLEKVKFRRPILPGDRMIVEAEVLSASDAQWSIKAACRTVSGVCSEALMTVAAADLPGTLDAIPAVDGECARVADIAMDTDKVMGLMPHRYPFLLIDYIAKAEGGRVIAVKNVTANEPYIDAGFSAVPEALMCEIAAQSGCASVLSRPENAGKLGFFMAIDKAVFHRLVLPGEQMLIDIDLPEGKSRFGKGSGVIRIGGEVVAEISLMFALVDA